MNPVRRLIRILARLVELAALRLLRIRNWALWRVHLPNSQDIDHINHALVPKAHPQMYLLHKWWARKPHNVVREYVETYTQPGDLVLDPFLGSGPTLIESLRTGRRAVGVDIDPLATFIARVTALHVDIDTLRDHFRKVQDAVRSDIEDLYTTKCPSCDIDVPMSHAIWADSYKCGDCGRETLRADPEEASTVNECVCGSRLESGTKVGSTILDIGYSCDVCIKRTGVRTRFLRKDPSSEDLQKLRDINKRPIPAWVPDDRLYYSNGRPFMKKEDAEYVTDLFEHRAVIALSLLYQAIDGLPKGPERDVLRLCFSSNLHSVSMLNMVHGKRWKKGTLPSRAWVIHSFYVPPLRIEFPVWYYFEERYDTFLAGKRESNEALNPTEGRSAKDVLDGRADFYTQTISSLELDQVLPDDSVDYVFTDPPYGGAIQYLELSTLYTSWLKGPTGQDFDQTWQDEITVNDKQNKDFDYYHRMLKAAFDKIFRVLKPGRYMTVTFHSTDIKVWNSILEAINLAGFELEKILYQPPPVKSIKAMMQPYGSAVGDYYIRFKKPASGRIEKVERDEAKYERTIVEAAKKILARRGEPTALTFILNGVMPELRDQNALLRGDRDIAAVLTDHLDEEFQLMDAVDDSGKVVGKKWWFKDPNVVPFINKLPLDERVEQAVIDILQSEIKVEFDEILSAVFERFPNALTPDQVSIKTVVDEYAEKTTGGQWRLRRQVELRQDQHSAMIRVLAGLGKKMGYKIWVGTREQRDSYEGTRLGELVDFDDLVLEGVSGQALDRLKHVDVLWVRDGRVRFLFEVENTTGITEALIRGSNLPYNCTRIVVLPEEREDLMSRKLDEPAFRERFDADGWRMMFYNRLASFWEENKSKARVMQSDFVDIIDTKAPVDEHGTDTLF